MISKQTDFQLCEYINKQKLLNLINSGLLYEEWTKEDREKKHKSYVINTFRGPKEQMLHLYNNLTENGFRIVNYSKDRLQGRHKLTSNCLSNMKRIYRNYLVCDDYYDFDMVNSCASIVLHLGLKHQSHSLNLPKSYVNNRSNWFKLVKKVLKCDDKQAKTHMTGLTFGMKWEYRNKNDDPLGQLPGYSNSLECIQTELQATHQYDFIETEKGGLSWLANLVQTIEDIIVIDLLNHISSTFPLLVRNENGINISVGTYEQDGFKLLKKNVDEFGGPDAVIGIIREWLDSNDYKSISFISKNMDEKVEISEVVNDNSPYINELKEKIQSPSPIEIETTFSPIVISPPTTPLISNDEIIDKIKYINELELKEENTKENKLLIKQAKMELKEIQKRQKEIEKQQKENERRQKLIEKENERQQRETEKNKKNYEKKMSQIQRELKKQEEIINKKQKKEEKIKQKEEEIKQKEEERQKLLSEIIIASNDDEASDILFDKLAHNFKSYKNRLFFKNGNIWITEKEKIDDYLLNEILKSNIYAGINPLTNSPISYAQNVNDAEKIKKALYSKIRIRNDDIELYKKFHLTTKAKLCFEDGVLDLKNKTFTLWENIEPDEIYTTIIIERNFNDYFNNPNEEDINEIQDEILRVLYGDDMDKALHFLSRAIAGHCEDKTWGTYLGNRNCGKGVQYDLLKNALGMYVSTFVLGNILCCRKSNSIDTADASKKLYWLIDLEFTRLAISQEVPDPATGLMANGVLLKGVMSGGDTLVARRNFDRIDTHFTTDATLFILGNYSLNTTTEDCNETRVQFQSLVQFKTEEEIQLLEQLTDEDGEKLIEDTLLGRFHTKDKTIKNKVKNDDWANAMVIILMRNYKEEPVNIVIDVSEVNTIYLLPAIKQLYNITNNNEDAVICKEVHSSLETFDKSKIELELKELGINKKRSKLRDETRDKICYFGIKKKNITTE